MKVLVVGGGGREHALVWKIVQSPKVLKVFCAPGNAGIARLAECVPIGATDVEGLIQFVRKEKVDLTVVGPEAPLCLHQIVDNFERQGLRIVGPGSTPALIEGSKIFAKRFMRKHNIPTADFEIFGDNPFSAGGAGKAWEYAKTHLPCVIKVDGLAAGKGAFPCFTKEQASAIIRRIMVRREFNGRNDIVIEDFLRGEEVTFMVLTDGTIVIPLLSTQDHKALLDDDKGPNTGGMGAYAPVPIANYELEKGILETIIKPAIEGMKKEGWGYKGVLYAGLMITKEGPKVLEFNCRFGDPELQPLVLLMESDIVPILWKIADRSRTWDYRSCREERLQWSEGAAVCVVMTSKGYPEAPEVGKEIRGLETVYKMENVVVFHAGTTREGDIWKTSGGRVLGVTAKAKSVSAAIELAYEAVSKIFWDGEHHRNDIARKALTYGVQLKLGV